MNIRLSLVKGIDRRALFPMSKLIHSYLQTNPYTKNIAIGQNYISFSKGIFFSDDHIKYAPYQIVCRDGVIFYDGEIFPNVVNDNLFTIIVNVLHQLRPGYICKI